MRLPTDRSAMQILSTQRLLNWPYKTKVLILDRKMLLKFRFHQGRSRALKLRVVNLESSDYNLIRNDLVIGVGVCDAKSLGLQHFGHRKIRKASRMIWFRKF